MIAKLGQDSEPDLNRVDSTTADNQNVSVALFRPLYYSFSLFLSGFPFSSICSILLHSTRLKKKHYLYLSVFLFPSSSISVFPPLSLSVYLSISLILWLNLCLNLCLSVSLPFFFSFLFFPSIYFFLRTDLAIAYSLLVYRKPLQVERLLRAIYRPQNL